MVHDMLRLSYFTSFVNAFASSLQAVSTPPFWASQLPLPAVLSSMSLASAAHTSP